MQKVTNLIDIDAPCQEVFDTVVDIERRMQLSPLWGLSELLEVAPNYPEPESSYRVRVLTDAPFGLSHGTLNATQSALSGLMQMLSLKLAQANRNHLKQSEIEVIKEPVEANVSDAEFDLPARTGIFCFRVPATA